MKLYKSYVFKDKDPVIDELRTIIEKVKGTRIEYSHLREIEAAGGPSISAMSNWFFGDTQRPATTTIEAAGRAIGWKRTWVQVKK